MDMRGMRDEAKLMDMMDMENGAKLIIYDFLNQKGQRYVIPFKN